MARFRRSLVALVLGSVAGGGCTCVSSSPGGGNDAGLHFGGGSDGGDDGQNDGGYTTGAGDSGTPVTCTPQTCGSVDAGCGPVGDGCGELLECGECDTDAGESCGGGGVPSQCGSGMTCLPRTCARAGANCGLLGDGCGGRINCGACPTGQVCGGDTPNVCTGSSVPPCTGLCQQQVTCPAGQTTSISGVVHAPTVEATFGAPDPLYNATVYIPNGQLADFGPTVTCETCGVPLTGDPLVTTTTDETGAFTLTNVPAGDNIPLVIQLGRWRRYTTVNVTPCVDNTITDSDQTRLPRTEQETSQWDHIPHIAMVTGDVDSIECVLRKIGIDDSQFGAPGSGSAVEMYVDDGATITGSGDVSTPMGDLTTMEKYDMIILACPGMPEEQSSGDLKNIVDYANAGGRVFATHYSYSWLYDNSPFSTTATWAPDPNGNYEEDQETALVVQTFTRGQAFADWVKLVGASNTSGQVTIQETRRDFTAVDSSLAQLWLYSTDPSQPLHYTFNTPVGATASAQCGRVLFSDFHVNDNDSSCEAFPDECDSNPMDAQEKVLEFMLFDLSSCVPTGGIMGQ